MKHKALKLSVLTLIFTLAICVNAFASLYSGQKQETVNNIFVTLSVACNYDYVDGNYAIIQTFSADAVCQGDYYAYQNSIGHTRGQCPEGATGWADFTIRDADGIIKGTTGVNLYISIYGETIFS